MAYRTSLNPGQGVRVGAIRITFKEVDEEGLYVFKAEAAPARPFKFRLGHGETTKFGTFASVSFHLARIQRDDGTANVYVKAPLTMDIQKDPDT